MDNFTKIYITSFDSKKIVTYASKNTNYENVILIAHGMAEHIERYEEFANNLVSAGYKVYAYSHRGHFPTDDKENYGYMGDNDNFEYLIKDLDYVIDFIKMHEENKKIILFAHSMGSFVSNRYSQLHNDKISGLILCGSGYNSNLLLTLASTITSILIFFKGRKHRSKFIDKLTFGSYNKKFKANRTAYDWLNRDEEEVDKYIADEKCGGIFTLAYFKYFFKGTKKLNKNYKKTPRNIPILLISGKADPVGGMGKGITKLYGKMKNTNVTLKLFDDCRHEILLEKNKKEIHNFIINWLLINDIK